MKYLTLILQGLFLISMLFFINSLGWEVFGIVSTENLMLDVALLALTLGITFNIIWIKKFYKQLPFLFWKMATFICILVTILVFVLPVLFPSMFL